MEFDLLITAEQVRSYKPAAAHFERARERIGQRPWLHVAQSQFHDIAPAQRLGIPAAWINRLDEPRAASLRPVPTFADLTGLARLARLSVSCAKLRRLQRQIAAAPAA